MVLPWPSFPSSLLLFPPHRKQIINLGDSDQLEGSCPVCEVPVAETWETLHCVKAADWSSRVEGRWDLRMQRLPGGMVTVSSEHNSWSGNSQKELETLTQDIWWPARSLPADKSGQGHL